MVDRFQSSGHHQQSKSAQGFMLEMPECCQHPRPPQVLGKQQQQTELPSWPRLGHQSTPTTRRWRKRAIRTRTPGTVSGMRDWMNNMSSTWPWTHTQSYEMYMRIIDMRNCLLPNPDEGSSHRAVAGASQEVDDKTIVSPTLECMQLFIEVCAKDLYSHLCNWMFISVIYIHVILL